MDPGSGIFIFSERLWKNIQEKRYCLRTIDLLFSLQFAILLILKTIEKTIGLLFLNNTLLSK